MSLSLDNLIDLRKDERRPALLAFALLALLIGGHTLLETARDALFLSKLPADRLALVYGLIAVLTLVVSAANVRFIQRFGEARALLTTLLLAAFGTGALYLQQPTPAVVFGLYVWSALLATVMVGQFWIFLGRVFTASQGRRLLGPIAAGGVLGAIAGAGGAATALAHIEVRSLLVAAAIAFVLAAWVATAIELPEGMPAETSAGAVSAESVVAAAAAEPAASSPGPAEDPQVGGWALLREYPYVLWLAGMTAVSTAAVLTTDYLFKANAAEHVAPAALGAYFARSYAVFNAAALVVQVFVSGPLVRRVGVTRSLLVMPVLLVAGAASALITGAPAAILVTKGVDGALRHSLHRVSTELLTLPLPTAVRVRVKPALDGVVTRSVQAIMAGVIFALAATHRASPQTLAALVVGLTLIWLAVALAIQRPHLNLFRRALSKGSLELGRPIELDTKSIELIVEAMSSRDPGRVISAMGLLAGVRRERFIPGLILYHESEAVLLHALGLMAKKGRPAWVPLAERLLGHASEPVRIAAVRGLVASRALDAAAKGALDPSPAVRAHAAIALASAGRRTAAAISAALADLLAATGEPGRLGRLALLDAIRAVRDRRFSRVLLELTSTYPDDRELIERAVLAMASIGDERCIPMLVQRLRVRAGRTAVRDALVEIGAPAQRAVEQALRRRATEPALRLHLPRTLSRFGNQRAASFLTDQLAIEEDGLVRYKVLRGLGRMLERHELKVNRKVILAQMQRNLVEHLSLLASLTPLQREVASRGRESGRLLTGLLEDKIRQSLERVFRLFQIAYRHEDIRGVYLALRSEDRRSRSDAMEFLDALIASASPDLESDSRELLRLVIDDLPATEKVSRAASHLPDAPGSYEEALLRLVLGGDAYLGPLAAYHALELAGGVGKEVERVIDRQPALGEIESVAVGRPTLELEVASADA